MEKEQEILNQNEQEKQNVNENEIQNGQKEVFEPMEVSVTDVVVEKGYATSGFNDPVTIQQWKEESW